MIFEISPLKSWNRPIREKFPPQKICCMVANYMYSVHTVVMTSYMLGGLLYNGCTHVATYIETCSTTNHLQKQLKRDPNSGSKVHRTFHHLCNKQQQQHCHIPIWSKYT